MRLIAVAAVALLLPVSAADAALCPAGQVAVSFNVSTGSAAPGAPDPRWTVTTPTGVPLVETTTPAYAVAPAPGWVAGQWISSTGAGTGVATAATAVRRSYQTE